MLSKMVLPNWHQNVELQEKSFSLLDCLKIFMAQISFWGSHYPGLKFQEVNFFWWQAIYEVCTGEENVVADLKMIKEVRDISRYY